MRSGSALQRFSLLPGNAREVPCRGGHLGDIWGTFGGYLGACHLRYCNHSAPENCRAGDGAQSAKISQQPGRVLVLLPSCCSGSTQLLQGATGMAEPPVPPELCWGRRGSSVPCPGCQLGRQKLYPETGHRNVTFCLMRFSKLPLIWKGSQV